MPRRDRGIAAAFARARAGDRRLGTWMIRHHDEMLRQLGTGRIQWTAPLAAFADLELTDEHGRPLTCDTASRTWRRVREAVAAARQAEARARPAPGELVPGVRVVRACRKPDCESQKGVYRPAFMLCSRREVRSRPRAAGSARARSTCRQSRSPCAATASPRSRRSCAAPWRRTGSHPPAASLA